MRILGGAFAWIGIAVMIVSASASDAGATFGAVAAGGVIGLGLLIVGVGVYNRCSNNLWKERDL